MSTLKTILFAIVVAASYFIEGIIGFGGTIIAIPLASGIAGIKLAVPVLTVVVFFASVVIAIRDFKYLDKKEFTKITLLMVVGLPIGMYLFKYLPEKPLKLFLSVFMIIIAIKGLIEASKEKKQKALESVTIEQDDSVEGTISNNIADSIAENSSFSDNTIEGLPLEEVNDDKKETNWISNLSIFIGGVVHGAFTCGGPFVVVYATNNIKDKSAFRATLCTLWAVLNGIMIVINIFAGDITREVINLSAWTMPFVILAIILSNIVHKKLEGQSFTTFVYIALFISGVLMAL